MHQTRLVPGDQAPIFIGTDQNGNVINLKDYAGRNVILYFYPKDLTPTCTKQACNLRDQYSILLAQNYEVIGISADNLESHKKFANKNRLPFSLIADTNKKIIHQYDVWGNKVVFGRQMQGIVRTTFVIDPSGRIEKVITKVESGKHAEQILKS